MLHVARAIGRGLAGWRTTIALRDLLADLLQARLRSAVLDAHNHLLLSHWVLCDLLQGQLAAHDALCGQLQL